LAVVSGKGGVGKTFVAVNLALGLAVQEQEPLLVAYPHSQAAWCIKQAAGAVLEGSEGRPAARFAPALPVGRFFRRLANLWAAG